MVKQWWSTIPPISTKRTITSRLLTEKKTTAFDFGNLGPCFTKGFRLILRPLTDKVCDRFTKLVGLFFFTISDLRLVVVKSPLCGGTKIDQFTRFAHLSVNLIIRSNKWLNTVILMVYVDTKNIKYSYFFGVM
jgi:hypothetical protein